MKSNAKLKVTQKEVEKSIEITIPNEEANDVTAGIIKNNHLKKLYSDYCILNQEFLSYVVSCKLSGVQLNMLVLFMSEMDKENKILINNEILMQKLGATKMTIINAIKKLTAKKIIVRQKLGVSKYEIQINYDILNPLLAFKNKASKENVKYHKSLMEQEKPYIKQENLFGEVDMINPGTGEVFYTYSQEQAPKHMLGTQKMSKQIESKNEILDIEYQDVLNPTDEIKLEEEKIYKLRNESLNKLETLKEKSLNWEMDNFYIDNTGTPVFRGINPYENQIKKIEQFLEKIDF